MKLRAVTCLGLAVALCAGCGSAGTGVRIPEGAQQADVISAFDLLRTIGVRVSTRQQYSLSALRVPLVVGVSPGPGSTVAEGSTVTLILGHGQIGSPAVLKAHPHYRVPSFVGKSADEAVTWAGRHSMFWEINRLPALHASAAAHLLDAYVVTGQTPRPGATLTQGELVGRSFHVTPLALTVKSR